MPRREHKITPKVISSTLYTEDGAVNLESPEWWHWLQQHYTFYVETNEGTFTARRERRGRFFDYYWYAYRRHRRKLYKVYVGKTKDLTIARLVEIARQLADKVDT